MNPTRTTRSTFLQALREQRWDDHRLYHHSRINQSLHLFSALCFLTSYVLLFTDPVAAVLVAWLLAMVSRQIGHFFFEPKGYDEINRASHAEKEAVKIGYNLRRKVILLSAWILVPALLLVDPTLFGAFAKGTSFAVALSTSWLVVAGAALVGRTLQLFVVRDVQTGLVWFTKILTDPFHDVWIYHRAPIHLLRGEHLDPMEPWPSVGS